MHNLYKKGYILIIEAILFISILMVISIGIISPIISSYGSIRAFTYSKQAFLTADSAMNEALYRLKTSKILPGSTNLTFASSSATITVSNTQDGKEIQVNSLSGDYVRKTKLNLQYGTGSAFHYGIQSGRGGFVLQNTSSITGNVFSMGTVVGSGNLIRGDVISAGPSGLVNNIHATGTVYSHVINNSIIDKDAYYTTISNTTVAGTKYPNSPDEEEIDLPISDAQIAQWEEDAGSTATMSSADCDSFSSSSNTCTISSSRTLGPIKIPFNLLIKSSSAVISLTGPIWVTGNITTQTGPTIKIDPSMGSASVQFIADDHDNRLTGSKIDIGQSTVFESLPSVKSYIFMISQNNSAEDGGSINAISMGQGASAMVAYASHGQITLEQSVSIKEATAYKIILQNSANVTYDTGLPNVLFSAGPGGGYDHIEWDEI